MKLNSGLNNIDRKYYKTEEDLRSEYSNIMYQEQIEFIQINNILNFYLMKNNLQITAASRYYPDRHTVPVANLDFKDKNLNFEYIRIMYFKAKARYFIKTSNKELFGFFDFNEFKDILKIHLLK